MSMCFKKLLFLTSLLFSMTVFSETVWVDVRSEQEYKEDHIAGDILIHHETIVAKVSILYPDKSTEIALYCRSGYRSDKAKKALEAAGYTQVSNAGGIADARKIRGISSSDD